MLWATPAEAIAHGLECEVEEINPFNLDGPLPSGATKEEVCGHHAKHVQPDDHSVAGVSDM